MDAKRGLGTGSSSSRTHRHSGMSVSRGWLSRVANVFRWRWRGRRARVGSDGPLYILPLPMAGVMGIAPDLRRRQGANAAIEDKDHEGDTL